MVCSKRQKVEKQKVESGQPKKAERRRAERGKEMTGSKVPSARVRVNHVSDCETRRLAPRERRKVKGKRR
jgi:hypothetical protein